MRRARSIILVIVAAALLVAVPLSAQTLTYTLFERYLDSYREQYLIPGLSVVVVQGGTNVLQAGLGKQDLEASVNATPDTPYFIGNLSQVFGATLLLRKCLDQESLELSDRVVRWVPSYPDDTTTIAQLLSHQQSSGAFLYDPARFAALTRVVEECADLPYRHVLAGEIFDALAMTRSVPGRALEGMAAPGGVAFSSAALARYNDLIGQMARPYRLVSGRPVRSTLPTAAADAANGAITTVRDLASFDKALRNGVLLSPGTLAAAWTQRTAPAPMPTGLGWFVQNYNGEPLVWQFDTTREAASSMVVKLPNRDITLILLANSDGLTAPFALASGDATASPFVRLFLRFFAP